MGIGTELVSSRKALANIGVEVPVQAETTPKRKKDEGLPMPPRLVNGRKRRKEAVK